MPGLRRRFTTFERRERDPLFIRKRDGERQPFDRAKLAGGLSAGGAQAPGRADADRAPRGGVEDAAEAAGGEIEAERSASCASPARRDLDRIAYLQFAGTSARASDPSEFAGSSSMGAEFRPNGRSERPGSVRR